MRLTAVLSMAAKATFPKDYSYGTSWPWTIATKRLNPPCKKRRNAFIEPIDYEDWSVFTGDTTDTSPEDTLDKTYTPSLKTLKEEAMEKTYPPSLKTLKEEAMEKTYPPSLKTLEEEAMEKNYPPSLKTLKEEEEAMEKTYQPSLKTLKEEAMEKTYPPSLKTLKEEAMEKLGIEEPKRNRKTYWY
ncbi:large ribosomal subunit protein uL24m-like [Oncorhynchus nerka]|uniref:large ribosomal subunit protein uL24m-like n=1 Tax=Oncorhynchus nerka TaxID=8023 RepID=UPI0031B844E6